MHSFLYNAICENLDLAGFSVYPSTRVEEMSIPCLVLSATFGEGTVSTRNWSFAANTDFTLIVPVDSATRETLEEAESKLIEHLRRLTPETLNLRASGPLTFYSGFKPIEIEDWQATEQFSEPALTLTIRGMFNVQR